VKQVLQQLCLTKSIPPGGELSVAFKVHSTEILNWPSKRGGEADQTVLAHTIATRFRFPKQFAR